MIELIGQNKKFLVSSVIMIIIATPLICLNTICKIHDLFPNINIDLEILLTISAAIASAE